MPGRDGTGPMGSGAMTGRGMGICAGNEAVGAYGRRPGLVLGCRRGFGRGMGNVYVANQTVEQSPKEQLEAQKEWMTKRLEAIDKQLEDL